MAEIAPTCRVSPPTLSIGWIVGAFIIAALAITAVRLGAKLPATSWVPAVLSPDPSNINQLLVHYTLLPRIVMSLLAGASLSLAGIIFQQVLRNPLAEPTTLGVTAGASMAMTVVAIVAPVITDTSGESVAFMGALAGLGLVFVLGFSSGRVLSPLRLIAAGLVVSLFCGTVASVVTLFHDIALRNIFIWNSGNLIQNDWSRVEYLAPRFAIVAALTIPIMRPLTIAGLSDEGARSLGLSLTRIRLIALFLATGLGAFVVSAVGPIGFIGLAAPTMARLSGARTLRKQLLWAPMFGALLLLLADQTGQMIGMVWREIPTGIVTSVLGAPLMLWLLSGLRSAVDVTRQQSADAVARQPYPWILIISGGVAAGLLAAVAFFVSRGIDGWQIGSPLPWDLLLELRGPRVPAALAAGTMLAVAGTLMQRMTGNAMASPEVLGISTGASLGVVIAMLAMPTDGAAVHVGAAAAGAFATLVAMLAMSRSSAYSPDKMLLIGIATATALGALLSLLMISGDPRLSDLLSWMTGSTYLVTPGNALVAVLFATVSMAALPLCIRYLEILPLGETTSRELGLDLARSRLTILTLAAATTGTATLIVGPLSFVGLMAPHMARMMGFQRVMPALFGSAVIGALIMVLADWLGRNLLFPYELPAGLLASFIGGPYFMWLMRRGTS